MVGSKLWFGVGVVRAPPAQATARINGGNKTSHEVSHVVGSHFEHCHGCLAGPHLPQGLEWQPEYAATLAAYYNASLDTLTSAKASTGFVRCSDGLGTARPARPVPTWAPAWRSQAGWAARFHLCARALQSAGVNRSRPSSCTLSTALSLGPGQTIV